MSSSLMYFRLQIRQLKAFRLHVVDFREQCAYPVAHAKQLMQPSLGDATAGVRRVLMRIEHGNLSAEKCAIKIRTK